MPLHSEPSDLHTRNLDTVDPRALGAESYLAGKRVEVILNAAAGALRKHGPAEEARRIADALDAAGARTKLHVSSPRQVRRRLAEIAGRPDVDVVLVGGGDGTISTAVQFLARSRKALGIVPLGTMNLLARDLALPLGLDACLDALVHARPRDIDVGEVNGRRFALNAILGLYPWVIRRRDQDPIHSRLGRIAAWFKVAPKALSAAPTFAATVEHDRGRERLRTHLLMVAAGPTTGGVGPLLRRESLQSGRLFVYHARHASRPALLKLVLAAAVGPWPASSEVDVIETRTATIRSRHRKLPVSLDGEVLLLRTPLQFRVLPRALRVLAPQAP